MHAFIHTKTILEHLLWVSLCDRVCGDNTEQILSIRTVCNLMGETDY